MGDGGGGIGGGPDSPVGGGIGGGTTGFGGGGNFGGGPGTPFGGGPTGAHGPDGGGPDGGAYPRHAQRQQEDASKQAAIQEAIRVARGQRQQARDDTGMHPWGQYQAPMMNPMQTYQTPQQFDWGNFLFGGK